MKRAIFATVLASWGAFATPAVSAEDLAKILEPIRAENDVPALAAAVYRNGDIVAAGAVGTRVRGMDIPVTVDDRFHIGSDAKAMTATIAATLVEQGKLSWTSTVGEVLGKAVPGMSPELSAIRLEQLLSHSSGIPTDDDEIIELYFNNQGFEFNPDELRLKILNAWKAHVPKVPAEGSPFQYANLGYIIAGAMIETRAGKPWDVLIGERIFEPLGLRSAGLGPQATFGRYDAAIGHQVRDDGSIVAMPWGAPADLPPVVGPAGIVHMSVLDFARWGGWNAAGGKVGPAIVKPETLAVLQRAHVDTPRIENPKPGTPKTGSYGFGWGIVTPTWADGPKLMHTGSNGMNLAQIFVDRDRGMAIAVMTNFPGERADKATSKVLETLFKKYAPEAAVK